MNTTELTYQFIRSLEWDYEPEVFIPATWRGTAGDILRMEHIPLLTRFWVVLRKEIIPEPILQSFAVWCAKEISHLSNDKHSIDALDAAERFVQGKVSKAELTSFVRRRVVNDANAEAVIDDLLDFLADAGATAILTSEGVAFRIPCPALITQGAAYVAGIVAGEARKEAYASMCQKQVTKLIEMLGG